MHNISLRGTAILAWVLAANGCTQLTTIGWSGADVGSDQPLASGARYASEVVAAPGELLQPPLPALGDIDGDGLDDFILLAAPLLQPGNSTVYLFYGRHSFSEKLDSQDADATFESGLPFGFPLGDVNGDGLADFALGAVNGCEFIFGSRERWSGHHEPFSAGLAWTHDANFGDPAVPTADINQAVKLGDINGDGYADFVFRVSATAAEDGKGSEILPTDYVIMGRKDGWPSGKWDPSWAAAQLEAEPLTSSPALASPAVLGGGDLDGDGLSDIIAEGYPNLVLFYGKREGFHGTFGREQADAELEFEPLGVPFVVGDLDGDGSDDFSNMRVNELQFFYGSHERYSGFVQPKADLTFSDQGPYSNPVVGDFNSDGHNDVVFVGNAEVKHWDQDPIEPIHYVTYQAQGTAQRRTDRIQLESKDVYQPIGYPAPSVLDTGRFNLNAGGDFDGDGSSDLIVGASAQQDPADDTVLLLPGAARAPD